MKHIEEYSGANTVLMWVMIVGLLMMFFIQVYYGVNQGR